VDLCIQHKGEGHQAEMMVGSGAVSGGRGRISFYQHYLFWLYIYIY